MKISNDRKMLNLAQRVMTILGAGSDILSTFGSYGDTMPDEEMIAEAEEWVKDHERVTITTKIEYKD